MKPFTTQGAAGQPVPLKYQPTITPAAFIPEGAVWKAPGTANRVNVYPRAASRSIDGEITVKPGSLGGATGFSAQAARVNTAAKAVAVTRGVFMGVLPEKSFFCRTRFGRAAQEKKEGAAALVSKAL